MALVETPVERYWEPYQTLKYSSWLILCVTLRLQVELDCWVHSISPAALTAECSTAYSTVSFFCGVKLLIYIILYIAWHQCWNIYLASVYLCLWGLLDFASLIYDIVADCSDNVPTRYLVNDACVLSSKPLVSASALRLEGQVMIQICIICSGFQTFLNRTLCACS